MKLHVTKDTTSKILHIFIQDSSATDGSGLTGIQYGYAGLVAYYMREGDTSSTAITLSDIDTLGTWVSGGFKEFDRNNMPGLYEIHAPDGALASGANHVVIMYHGATNMAPVVLEVQLTDMDFNTSLPTFFDLMDISSIGYVSSNQMQVTSQFIELASTVDANVVQVDGSDVELGTVLDANVTQISGDETAADNAELFFDDTGFAASNSTIGTATTLTNSPANFTSLSINTSKILTPYNPSEVVT